MWLCFIIAVIAGCVPGAGRTPSSSLGLTVIGPQLHHFPPSRQGETLVHVFMLANNSNNSLEIVELYSTCTCLVTDSVDPGKQVLVPRQTKLLSVSLATGSSQDTVAGRVLVRYRNADEDSGAVGELSLILRVDVLPDYRVTPALLDLGIIDGLRTPDVTRVVRLEPLGLSELVVHEVRTTADFLHAHVQQADGHSPVQIEVTLQTAAFLRSRDLKGALVVSTNSPRLPEALIRVRGQFRAAVEVEPDAIIVSSEHSDTVVRELRFISACPSQLLQVSTSSLHAELRVDRSDDEIAEEHFAALHIPPTEGAMLYTSLTAELALFPLGSDDPIHRTVTIPVYRFAR